MNILYDHQIFALQRYGGVSRYFVELVRQLDELDDPEIMILAPFHINRHLRDLRSSRVSGRYLSVAPPGTSKALTAINRVLSRRRIRQFSPHIVHETYYTGRPVTRSSRTRTVLTVYDMVHERLPQFFPHSDAFAALKRQALQRADHVLCISETTRQDLLEFCNLDADAATTVHLGFSVSGQHSAETSPIEQPYLLYVGLRGGYKNFSRLISAYAGNAVLHAEFRLVCFGGQRPTTRELEPLAEAGLSSDAFVWLRGDDTLLASLYRHASAFVYPSLYEGFGMPPLEAMSQGCPVVCSRGGSIPEVVGDAAEFFDAESVHEISAAIERVVASPARAAELRAAGQRRVAEFSWGKCADRTRAVYEALM